jgi:hypothetical protein
MPVLAGIEAAAVALPGAETGHPEMSAEFAKRMKNYFVLKGPHKQKEGEGTQQKLTIKIPAQKHETTAQPEQGEATEDLQSQEQTNNQGKSAHKGHTEAGKSEKTLLVNVLAEVAEGIDLEAILRDQCAQDPLFKAVVERPKQYRNFEVQDSLVYLRLQERVILCVPKVYVKGRSVREIVITEAYSLLAHLGASKMLAYLQDYVWWKEMAAETMAYCNSCSTCK